MNVINGRNLRVFIASRAWRRCGGCIVLRHDVEDSRVVGEEVGYFVTVDELRAKAIFEGDRYSFLVRSGGGIMFVRAQL